MARFLARGLLRHVKRLQINVGVRLPEWHALDGAVSRLLHGHEDLLATINAFSQIGLAFLPLVLSWPALGLWSLSQLFACLLRLSRILPITIPLHPVESSVHVHVLEMGTRLRALVLLAGVIVKVDSFIVEQIITAAFILPSLLVLATFLLYCLSAQEDKTTGK